MNPATLRILDANLTRAREALRTIEDYARFWLDDKELSSELKTLRHRLAAATESLGAEAILHRDTPNDVGTGNKTSRELYRANTADIVTAAGKRFGEALRTLEEFSKTQQSGMATQLEAIRYLFYDLEKRVAITLRPAAAAFASVRLYVLITESQCKRPWLDAAREAIEGGADCLQLREKSLESGEFLRRAKQFVALCRRHHVISIINDRIDITLASGADGVHVGQDDLPAADVRKLVGLDKRVGVSTHKIEQAQRALMDGADYIGVGPVFRSSTKPRDFLPGLDYARQVATELGEKIPAVAIAGITEANVDEVLATGIRAIAVTAAVIACDDVKSAARRLKERLTR
jgi:thiamine-phosphate pyrophosphorylase